MKALSYSHSGAVLLLFAALPFVSIPKIFLGLDVFPVVLDVYFLAVFSVLWVNSRRLVVDFSLLFMIFLFVISLVYFFYSVIPGLYNKLTAYRLSAFCMLFFMLPFAMSIDRCFLDRLFRVFVVAGLIVAVNGVRQWVMPVSAEIDFAYEAGGAAKFFGGDFVGQDQDFRIFSTFSTSVHLVVFLSLISYLILTKYFVLKRLNRLEALALVLSVVCIVLTFSRTGWVAFIIGLVAMLISTVSKKNLLTVFAGLLVAVAVVVVFYIASPIFEQRLDSLMDYESISSFQSRELLWDSRVVDIENRPTGYGTGAASWSIHWVMGLGADSNYLKLLLEYGVIFGSIFIVFIFMVVAKIAVRSLWPIALDVHQQIFLVAIFSFLVAVLVQMYTNQVLEAYPSNALFWFFSGLGMRLCRI